MGVIADIEVAAPLAEAIRERVPKVKGGEGMDPASEMGPLVTREHRDKVASYIEGAPGEGASVVVDGRERLPEQGFFLNPTLLDDVKPGMRVYADEIFGPVLGITRVDTYDEAVRLVNGSPYGNGTAIFTRDGGVARQFQFDVQVGMVGINVPIRTVVLTGLAKYDGVRVRHLRAREFHQVAGRAGRRARSRRLREEAAESVAETAEAAEGVLWMCSPGGSYLHGHSLILDGGMTSLFR